MAELEAGRELDALVAERVMGWKWFLRPDAPRKGWVNYADLLPSSAAAGERTRKPVGGLNPRLFADGVERLNNAAHYSTDIASAWLVVEKMREKDWWLDLIFAGTEVPKWEAEFRCVDGPRVGEAFVATDNTAPLAICRAALLAMDAWRRNGGA